MLSSLALLTTFRSSHLYRLFQPERLSFLRSYWYSNWTFKLSTLRLWIDTVLRTMAHRITWKWGQLVQIKIVRWFLSRGGLWCSRCSSGNSYNSSTCGTSTTLAQKRVYSISKPNLIIKVNRRERKRVTGSRRHDSITREEIVQLRNRRRLSLMGRIKIY